VVVLFILKIIDTPCEAFGPHGWQPFFKHCEEGNMDILRNLNFTINQNKNVKDELELASS
jgi:hypothetical protein